MKKKVLAIMLVAVSTMLISACGKKEKLYEIPDLSKYKTDYVQFCALSHPQIQKPHQTV